MIKDIFDELQSNIKIKFANLNLLKQSLVHKSFDHKNNNEKLEFLGDRVLGLIMSKALLVNYPNEKEGIIDKKFANLVNKKTCAEIGVILNLKKYMLIGGSYKGLKRSDEKIIGDCLEALIGAIFLDKGLGIVEKFVLKYWSNLLEKSDFTIIDSKTQLQEYSLKKYKMLPKYKFYKETGPKHSPVFKVVVQISESKKYYGTGSSKKNAQQNAAKNILKDILV